MTPKDILNAYVAIQELVSCILPYKASRDIQKLAAKLKEEYNTVLWSEKNLVDSYGGIYRDKFYDFKTPDIAQEFINKYNEFMEQQDDIELPKIDLSKYANDIKISATAIEALKDIVYFGED